MKIDYYIIIIVKQVNKFGNYYLIKNNIKKISPFIKFVLKSIKF